MDVLMAIKERRSVRKYKPEPIPEDKLTLLLEAVRYAPSWANTQCWELILVDKPEMKENGQNNARGKPGGSRLFTGATHHRSLRPNGKGRFFKGQPATDKGDRWFMFDMGIAMQNLCLAAQSLGLGTVHVGAFDAARVQQILKVPEGIAVVDMVPVGFPDEKPRSPARKAIKDFVFYHEYGKGTKVLGS